MTKVRAAIVWAYLAATPAVLGYALYAAAQAIAVSRNWERFALCYMRHDIPAFDLDNRIVACHPKTGGREAAAVHSGDKSR